MERQTKEVLSPTKEMEISNFIQGGKTRRIEATINSQFNTRSGTLQDLKKFGNIAVTNLEKGQGLVHWVQGINHHPCANKYQALRRHHEIDQHGINPYDTVNYVYKGHEEIWFHQRWWINHI